MIIEQELAVEVRPLADQTLIEVLREKGERSGGLVLPDEERSQQGVLLAVGPEVDDADVRPGDRVLFDDEHCPYWRGSVPMSFLSVLLAEGTEYVVVPRRQLLAVIREERIVPLDGYVLASPLPPAPSVTSTIVSVPVFESTDEHRLEEATVVTAGPGWWNQSETARLPVEVQAGQVIAYRHDVATELTYQGQTYVLVDRRDILGVRDGVDEGQQPRDPEPQSAAV